MNVSQAFTLINKLMQLSIQINQYTRSKIRTLMGGGVDVYIGITWDRTYKYTLQLKPQHLP